MRASAMGSAIDVLAAFTSAATALHAPGNRGHANFIIHEIEHRSWMSEIGQRRATRRLSSTKSPANSMNDREKRWTTKPPLSDLTNVLQRPVERARSLLPFAILRSRRLTLAGSRL